MDNYRQVLVGTDGSPDATAAVHIGATVAARLGVPLRIVHVGSDDGSDSSPDSSPDNGADQDAPPSTGATTGSDAPEAAVDTAAGEHRDAEAILRDAVGVAAAAGVTETTTSALTGKPAEVLLELADADPEQLVVVGSEGLSKTTSRLMGSTSNKLSHHSLADVLLTQAKLPDAWNFVALATDGSPTSLTAVRRGLLMASALGATPRLVTAAKTVEAGEETLAAAAAALGLDDTVEREVFVDSHTATAVRNASWKYELVVIGNRGMSGPSRILGSIANSITHELRTNLLLVNTTRS